MKTESFKAGDWVEVLSKAEILATLDAEGRLDGMPFMPEMFRYCGQRFQVYKSAHKTCDTVFPIRGLRVHRAVHLETRCDGSAHGGCQAGCLIFWKEDWLKASRQPAADTVNIGRERCEEVDASPYRELTLCEHAVKRDADDVPKYTCQATQLPYCTTELPWWEMRQYVEDYRSGNVTAWRMLSGLAYSGYYHLSRAGIGLGRPMRWFYNNFHGLWNGTRFPRSTGTIAAGEKTPTGMLNLQPGERVKVKSHEEILKTLNVDSRNRGLYWDAELVPYCGGTYNVLKRVSHIVDEKTGYMQDMKNPCIILDSVVCQARYSKCRMFCPRSIYPYWREIWLERVQPAVQPELSQPELSRIRE
ncbi:MAG: hypothetical protein ABI693_03470 [Bryobacteraceae bacterium]